jgi:hypothetical protein
MREFVLVLASIALTAVSWGVYGPLMRSGNVGMEGSHLLPFICVGLAYFAIGVVVPLILMRLWHEKGSWTVTGVVWSFVAGVGTSLGALGINLAFTYGGSALYVMPLVFGGAPVVNTFVSMWIAKSYKQAGPMFFAGLILVIVGAVCVLVFKPSTGGGAHGVIDMLKVGLSIALTIVMWGAYGPILHKGQMYMQGSRLRPLICVGMAYLLVAVVLTSLLVPIVSGSGEWEKWHAGGVAWSLAGGAAGAVGAIGIILAFNYGGKPVYVMPLVFGGAPVINALVTVAPAISQGVAVSPLFFAGLIVVIAGAATVLVFAPKPVPHAAHK